MNLDNSKAAPFTSGDIDDDRMEAPDLAALLEMPPESHALYGVTTHIYSTDHDKGLLPSRVQFYLGEDVILGDLLFQNGPPGEYGVNGIGIEHLLHVVAARLRGYQKTKLSCRENALALTKVEEALHWLEARTKDRQKRGVEGKDQQT